MARYPRENDTEIGKIFFYCDERYRNTQGTYKYGHPYKIVNVLGTFPDMSIVLQLVNMSGENSNAPLIVAGTEYFFLNFMFLDDEEMFALQLAQDTGVAGITIYNEPLSVKEF
jgi:hypothetical protein